MNDKDKFVAGMRVTRHEKAPDFVKASIGVNIGDFLVWANAHAKNGWVNFQIKESRGGKLYAELDSYEPKPKAGLGEVDMNTVSNTPETPCMTSTGYNGEAPINVAEIPFWL